MIRRKLDSCGDLDLVRQFAPRGHRCEVLELQPHDKRLALTHFNLGTFYERTNDPSQGMEHYRRALEFDAALADSHFDLAELLSRSGRLAEALPH